MFGMPETSSAAQRPPSPPPLPPLREFDVEFTNGKGEVVVETLKAMQHSTVENGSVEFVVYRYVMEGRPPIGQVVRAIRQWHDIKEVGTPFEIVPGSMIIDVTE